MKNKCLISVFLIFLFGFYACSTNKNSSEGNLPLVKNATYKSYVYENERGYHLQFELNKSDIQPTSIVFNKIEQKISRQESGLYNVNIIVNSSKIVDFQPKKNALENGLLFSIDGEIEHKKVEFKKEN